ncbi:MAG: universal stress protein [Sphingobacteriia bacterium]|nr:MAG: universal stress protein [Sphingobacteriia bacterium]
MHTIIVPTDFSTTAANAAAYAVQFAEQINVKRILLFHAYELPVALDPLMPGVQMLELDSYKEVATNNLEDFRNELRSKFPNAAIQLDVTVEYGSITGGIEMIATREKIELIIMGITGGGALAETLIGSNTTSVAGALGMPVLIIPLHAKYNPVKKIMLSCDFDHADKFIPVNIIRSLIKDTHAKLLVFNIEVDMEETNAKYPASMMGEGFAVHTLLQEFQPEYHFTKNKEYVDGVNEYADSHEVDMIISIPKRKGFFEKLFIKSTTKKLAFHTHLPLLVVHKQVG